MAVFMLSENKTIHIQSTEISHNDGYVVAWYGEDNSPNKILLIEKKISKMTHNFALWLDKERKEKSNDGSI